MSKHYDEICNHCGKEIHPPDLDRSQAIPMLLDWSPDCIWIERYIVRDAPIHPLTNYICTECAAWLGTWLEEALANAASR